MKVYYNRSLDPAAAHESIAGVNVPNLKEVEAAIVAAVSSRLNRLPKKWRSGASVTYLSAGADTRAYRFPMNGIKVVATLTTTGIRVDQITREKRYPKVPQRVQIALTDAQKDIIAQNAVTYALSAA
tara:strand:- start:1148 stop:1528 length:381 start_codon:yes stop_codon:yes gene_type:complete